MHTNTYVSFARHTRIDHVSLLTSVQRSSFIDVSMMLIRTKVLHLNSVVVAVGQVDIY